MWPWEHLAFGYLLYSLLRRLSGGVPDHAPVFALAVGTQFPDIVDKPLTWTLGVLPGGTFAHTVFVAGPVVLLALVRRRRGGHGHVSTAFSVGYLSHLAGDAIYPILLGDSPEPGRFFWPLVPNRPSPRPGFFENVFHYLGRFLRHADSPEGTVLIASEIGLLTGVFVLWAYDGAPGLAPFRRLVGGTVESHDSERL